MSEKADRLKTTPLHPEFGVKVHDVDLHDVTADRMSPAIRALFERHSLLPLPEQRLNDREHLSIGRLFGPIEDRSNTRMDGEPRVYHGVSNETEDGGVDEEDNLRMLGLKANMPWHTDSTFLAMPALANALQARVVPDKGGATELVSAKTGPSHIHDHHWRPGNVLVRDERGATHRGAPWPSDQARRLVSCCTSHGDADGLSVTRP